MQIEMKGYVGTNTSGNHNKFYEVFSVNLVDDDGKAVKAFFYKRYGKIGQVGIKSVVGMDDDCSAEVLSLTTAKKKRGYVMMEQVSSRKLNGLDFHNIRSSIDRAYDSLAATIELKISFKRVISEHLATEIYDYFCRDFSPEMKSPESTKASQAPVNPYSNKYESWGDWA